MARRMGLRWIGGMALLCSAARPAFADGVSMEGWGTFFVLAGIVLLIGLITLILLLRWMFRALEARARRREEEPPVPRARVVQDRSKPS